MNWRNLRLCVLLMLVSALSACGGKTRLKLGEAAGGEVVEAVGETMATDDLLQDKKRALVEAQKKAIEMVVGLEVRAKTRVEKAVTIEQHILAKTQGYIQKYDLLEEWPEPPFYKAKIRALVSYRQIHEDLNALGLLEEPQVGNPRVAVLFDGSQGFSAAADAFSQALLDRGYRVVERSREFSALAKKVAEQVSAGDTSELSDLAGKMDAEVLVFGESKAEFVEMKELGGMISSRAALTAKAYKANSRELLLTVHKLAGGIDVLKEAAALKSHGSVGAQAGAEMATRLAAELSRRASVALTVDGVPSLNDLSEFQKTLSAVAGVGDIYVRSYGQGRAKMDVRVLSVSTKDIAGGLEKSLGARVDLLTADSLSLTLPQR
ncbi:MAG: hypothetical protein HY611_10310 [Elusimicrobia bacterium]|nr:hypothetical protein [Elusimicrobiota bacterium]